MPNAKANAEKKKPQNQNIFIETIAEFFVSNVNHLQTIILITFFEIFGQYIYIKGILNKNAKRCEDKTVSSHKLTQVRKIKLTWKSSVLKTKKEYLTTQMRNDCEPPTT